jgi:hypothetical protein
MFSFFCLTRQKRQERQPKHIQSVKADMLICILAEEVVGTRLT